MEAYAKIVFGFLLSQQDQKDFNGTEEIETAVKRCGARFEFSGDAVTGPVEVILAAGESFEASCPGPSPVAFELPQAHPAWHASIRAAARELDIAGEEPRWLLVASAS